MQPDPSWMAEMSWFLRDKIGVDGCLWALAFLLPPWFVVRLIRVLLKRAATGAPYARP